MHNGAEEYASDVERARARLLSTTVIGRSKRADRIARYIITGGGAVTIITVGLVLLLIVGVALPLFVPARSELSFEKLDRVPPVPGGVAAVGIDEYLETAHVIDRKGDVYFCQAGIEAELPHAIGLEDGVEIATCDRIAPDTYGLVCTDGSALIVRILSSPAFSESGIRELKPEVRTVAALPALEGDRSNRSLVRQPEAGALLRLDVLASNRIRLWSERTSENFLGEVSKETSESWLDVPPLGELMSFALSTKGNVLYAGTSTGHLVRWALDDPAAPLLEETVLAAPDGSPITALGFVFGDISIAVGDAKGRVSTWFPVPKTDGSSGKQLRQIHTLAQHDSAVKAIQSSRRNKAIASLSEGNRLHIDHMTSERHLATIQTDWDIAAFGFAARANGLVAASKDGGVAVWSVDAPHPEVSVRTLFGKVWYEHYPEPEYVWQSSASNDDNEAKMSLVPLIFGSFKGTFYAMIFAAPIALLGAVYTSQFASPRFRGQVKPAIEIMAAIPSVVIGFLAALWLAPVLEDRIIAVFLFLATFPLTFGAFIAVRQMFHRSALFKALERGYEFLAVTPVVIFAALLAVWFSGPIEAAVFDGDFKSWFFRELGGQYDQRNCIVISFALGFAVIPLIFTLAEDALSNVPHSLKAASLALGASRWQTVWRVVLPSASPGIFAAIIIGLGRAIGETMIVLMATGNTPILDPSIFNGMRTLSANIAVEIPEAPINGTLYRVLFLSAVILFLLTSVLNTTAEIVRHRLRKKYGQFQ